MPGPRYDLVPPVGGTAPPSASPEPPDDSGRSMKQRAAGYGWAALAITTLLLAFTLPGFIPLVWLVAALKRWVLPRLT